MNSAGSIPAVVPPKLSVGGQLKPVLPLFIFIDACGWEILKGDPFGFDFAPHRHRLRSVFGYSSACVPSILSGGMPMDHRNWSYFVYDPKNSPFKCLRPLRWLPSFITSRRRFRRLISRLVKERLNFRGYFDLYNVPFNKIDLYDFSEKRSPLRPGGMNRGTNIFDHLTAKKIPYHASDPDKTEQGNLEEVAACIRQQSIDFAFVYWPGLDALLHRVGNQSPLVPARLREYEMWIRQLIEVARRGYREVRLYVFSDHGMANCDQLIDLKPKIDALPLRVPDDYAVVYDSTMARFWFFREHAKELIKTCLAQVPEGRIMADDELKQLGVFFSDRYFGELIFVVREGVLIVPSHMGARPIRAMHGYHPDEPQSYAALCTNQPSIPEKVEAIPDMFRLMTAEAELARAVNS